VSIRASRYDAAMSPFAKLTGRAGPVGLALTAWDIWRRIPVAQRRQLMRQARRYGPTVLRELRKHGPTVARQIAEQRRNRRR
jgi:hypothetical protein